MPRITDIKEFDFEIGKKLAGKYRVLEKLGVGYEGEVYRIMELDTGIIRAAKIFFPQRNMGNKTATRYAKLLHQLSSCPIVIHYHTMEEIVINKMRICCLITEFVDGMILSEFLKRQPGGYIGIFRGLQLLHALISGLETMHNLRTYHGDLHTDNVIVKRYGLGFELKVMDMFNLGREHKQNRADDICDSIRVFFDAIGGAKRYAKHPKEIKEICLGLKRSLIIKKFRTAAYLRDYLENIEWQSPYRE